MAEAAGIGAGAAWRGGAERGVLGLGHQRCAPGQTAC
jgi:hypothetical protein